VRVEEIRHGIIRIRVSNRLLRFFSFEVDVFLLDELLVDTGYRHERHAFLGVLQDRRVGAIALTHHHEDHSGNAGVLAERFGAPVFLARPELRWSEGLDHLLPYRQVWWGEPAAYDPQPMPAELETGERTVLAVPTPGHSATHTVIFDPDSRVALVGDLYLSGGLTPVLQEEDPVAQAASLRRLAALGPRRLLNAHGKIVENAVAALEAKAEQLEEAVAGVRRLHGRGAAPEEIEARLFPSTRATRFAAWMTQGDYTYGCLVRAALRLERQAPESRPEAKSRREGQPMS
jgi:glyoxylase-like metal-dependent hydrolase (beta-lactamase superfamily II)